MNFLIPNLSTSKISFLYMNVYFFYLKSNFLDPKLVVSDRLELSTPTLSV
jgi:hypothetical protein